jgi:hypothetical protein
MSISFAKPSASESEVSFLNGGKRKTVGVGSSKGGRLHATIFPPKVTIPNLKPIAAVRRAIYVCTNKYANYLIAGSFDVQNKRLLGHIKYIHKTEYSKGLDSLFKALESDAIKVEAAFIQVQLDQCSEILEQKLRKHAKANNFTIQILPELVGDGSSHASNNAGEDILITKTLSK